MVKFEIPDNLDDGPSARFSIFDMDMSEDDEFSKSFQSQELVPTTETQSIDEQCNMKVAMVAQTVGSFTMEFLLSGLDSSLDLTAVVERVLLKCYTSEQSLVSITQTGSFLARLRAQDVITVRIFLWIEVRNAEAVIDSISQDKKTAKVGYFQEEIVRECAILGIPGNVTLEQLEVFTACPNVPYVKVFDRSVEDIPPADITLQFKKTDKLSKLGEDQSNLSPYLPDDIPLHYERPIRDAIFLLSLQARGRIYPHMLPRQCPERVTRAGNNRAVLKVVKVCLRGQETTVEILVDRVQWMSRNSFSVLRTRLDELIDKAVGADREKRKKVDENKRTFSRDRNFCTLGPRGLLVSKHMPGNIGELHITKLGSPLFRIMGVDKGGENNLLHHLMACHENLHAQPPTNGAEFIQRAAKEYKRILQEEQSKVETKFETEEFALKRMYRKLREKVGVLTRENFTKYLQNELDFLPLESHRVFSRLDKGGGGEITQSDFLLGADLPLDEYKEGVELQLKRVLKLVCADRNKESQGLLHFLNSSIVAIQRLVHCFELATIFWPGKGEAGPLTLTAPQSQSSVVRVQEWLQKAVAKEVEKDLQFLQLQEDSEESVLEQIYTLLTGNMREDAAELAMGAGYYRLATLICSDNKAESRHFQNSIMTAISGWKEEGVWATFSEPLRKIYSLLSGEFQTNKDCSWFRVLAQLSWFGEPLAGLAQLMNILNREISRGKVVKPEKDDILFWFIQGYPFDEFFDTLPCSLLEGLEWHFVDMLVHACQLDRLHALFTELRAGAKEPRISRASLEALLSRHRNTEILWRALTKLSGKQFINFDNFACIFRRIKIYAPSCYEWMKDLWEDQLNQRHGAVGTVNLPASIMMNLPGYCTRCHVSCLETHGYLRWAAYCLIMTGRYPFHPDPALVRRIVRLNLDELETRKEKADFRKRLKAHFPRLINSRI